MEWQDEKILSVGLFISTMFLYANVSKDVGTFYGLGVLAYIISLYTHWKKVQILRPKSEIVKLSAIVSVITIVWMLLSVIATFLFTPHIIITNPVDLFRQIGSRSNIPVLVPDLQTKIFIYGTLIPIIESMIFLSIVLMFFSVLLRLDIVNIPDNITKMFNLKIILLCCLVGITGSLFHFYVRMGDSYTMMTDFIFFTISAFIVVRYKELASAILFHIITNTFVILVMSGLI